MSGDRRWTRHQVSGSRWLATRLAIHHPTSLGIVAMSMSLVLSLLASGCAPYQFGPQALYRPGIRTVYVPVIRNGTFRHDLGLRLTEALIKEIELRTPYKVTGDPNADSTLTCQVVNQAKRVLTEAESDDPRALDAYVIVQASWTGRSGEPLMVNQLGLQSDAMITFGQDSRFVPEAGQSVDTAMQAAIDDLAQRIVAQMEARW